jgi:hypothetical protein
VLGDFLARGSRFGGVYLGNRRSYTKYLKAFSLGDAVEITVESDSTLALRRGDETTRLAPIGPLLFRDVAGDHLVGFREDSSGRITHAFQGNLPMVALERLPWWQDPSLHLKLLGLGVLTFLIVVWRAVARWFRRADAPAVEAPSVVWRRRLLVTASLAGLAFAIGVAILGQNPTDLILGSADRKVAIVLTFPVIAGIATIGGVGAAVIQWRKRAGTLAARIGMSAAVIFTLLFLWSLSQWNLLGWKT